MSSFILSAATEFDAAVAAASTGKVDPGIFVEWCKTTVIDPGKYASLVALCPADFGAIMVAQQQLTARLAPAKVKAPVEAVFHNKGELKAVEAEVAGVPVLVQPKAFSTGSKGWYANGKVTITLADGQLVTAQMGITLTIVGSKPKS